MIRGGSHQWGSCWKSSRVGNVSPFLSPRRRSLSAARGAQARTPGTRGPFCELGIASLKGPAPGAGGRQAEAGAPRGFSVATAVMSLAHPNPRLVVLFQLCLQLNTKTWRRLPHPSGRRKEAGRRKEVEAAKPIKGTCGLWPFGTRG